MILFNQRQMKVHQVPLVIKLLVSGLMLTVHERRYSGQHRWNFQANITGLTDLSPAETSISLRSLSFFHVRESVKPSPPGSRSLSSAISRSGEGPKDEDKHMKHRHGRRAKVIFLWIKISFPNELTTCRQLQFFSCKSTQLLCFEPLNFGKTK